MALVLADRVKETTTTTGTGTVTLAGASAGYRSFATVGNGNTTYYTISGQTTSEWEVGIGTYTSVGTTLSRTTVLSSSNGGSLVVFSAGTKDVFVTYPAGRSVNVDAANTVVSVPQLSATSIINSGLTSGRVVYSTTGGLETDSANLTYNGTNLSVSGTGTTTLVKNITTTAANGFQTNSTGGNFYFGIDSSTNNFYLTGTPYGRTIYSDGAYPIVFFTNATSRMTLDSSGNLGLGVTPSVWTGLGVAIETVGGALLGQGTNNITLYQNTYYSSGYKYKTTGYQASYYQQNSGSHQWFNAPSGTAGNAITFTQAMTLDSSGNLGLGVTPSAWNSSYKALQFGTTGTLYSASNAAIANNMYINSGAVSTYITTAAASLYLQNSGVHAWYNAPSGTAGNAITFTQAMTLDTSGNLGVGTSSPFTRLDSAAARATTLNSIALFNTMAASVTDTTAFAVGVGGGINFRAQLSVSSYSTLASIWSYKESATSGDYKGSLVFGTTANATGYPTERMRIDSSGNLGIGTTSPSAKLNVVGADAAIVGLIAGATNGIRIVPKAGSAEVAATDKTGSVSYQQLDLNGSLLAFLIGNTERMRLDASGNLGIGTSSPGAKLDVQGANAYIRIKSTSGTYALFDIDSPAASQPIIRFLSNGVEQARIISPVNEAASQLVFTTGSSSTERMRIDGSGNVGIGTSSPITKLNISGSSSVAGELGTLAITGSTTAKRLAFGVDSTSTMYGWIQSVENGVSTRDLILQSIGGNVGIGTSSPGGKIEASSSTQNIIVSRSTGSYAAFQRIAPTGQQTYDFYTINGVEVARITGDPSCLTFSTGSSATERMRIDSSGNLLVGTTASAGSISNTAPVVAGVFKTLSGTVSAASATATTIATLPSVTNGTYIVSCGLNTTDPTNYSAVSLVTVDATALRITNLQTATLMSISVSGQTVRATQTSGITITIYFTLTRVS